MVNIDVSSDSGARTYRYSLISHPVRNYIVSQDECHRFYTFVALGRTKSSIELLATHRCPVRQCGADGTTDRCRDGNQILADVRKNKQKGIDDKKIEKRELIVESDQRAL